MSLGTKGVVDLKDLSKTDSIYLGSSDEGDLHFRECEVTLAGKVRKLELAELLAMALTERCSEIGVGVVKVRRKARTKLEQRDWTGKSHKNRYILLNGRQIEESEIETYLLPISLAHYRVGSSPRFNLDTVCPVILYLDPNPILGYTCDMLNAWTRFQFLGHRAMDNRWMNAMEKFEMGLPDSIWMENVNDILDGLQKIYHDDKPNATIDLFSIHQVDISIAEDLGIKGDMGQAREEEPDETEDSIEVDLTNENEEESSP